MPRVPSRLGDGGWVRLFPRWIGRPPPVRPFVGASLGAREATWLRARPPRHRAARCLLFSACMTFLARMMGGVGLSLLAGCAVVPPSSDEAAASRPGTAERAADGASASPVAAPIPGGTPLAGAIPQPTTNSAWKDYRSSRRDQLFLYQGSLANLGATPEDVAKVMRPFDVIVLTNVLPVRHAGPGAPALPGRVEAERGFCMSDGLPDGWSGTELLRQIRVQNPNAKIYGYVPSTADLETSTGVGCTSNLIPDQNYACRGGVCSDFVRWIDAWRSLERAPTKNGDPGAFLDGIYVDLLEEFYVSASTWSNQAAYVHATTNALAQPYGILGNITVYNRAGEGFFYENGRGPVRTRALSSVGFAASQMRQGDAIYREGFLLVAGTYEDGHTLEMMNELVDTYRTRGIRWAVSASELGSTYVPGTHVSFAFWKEQNWISPGSCYVGPTGESVAGGSRPYSACNLLLAPPFICGTQNNRTTYDTYKAWADGFTSTPGAGGGMGFAFTEARLGVFNGIVPFCPNDF